MNDIKKLVLFDIDGTLVDCGKVPKRAFMRALEIVFGSFGIAEKYNFSGRTDVQIASDVMTGAGFDGETVSEKMPAVLAHYLEHLNENLKPDHVTIKPGIRDVLDRLVSEKNACVGLLTGNIEKGAVIKLDRAGLGSYFSSNGSLFGAFGSDSMDRYDLPAIAAQKAQASFGETFSGKQIVVIGDSIHDVLCGKALNVRSIAVATGWTSEPDLRAGDPDDFFTDFSETDRVLESILF